MVLKKKSPTHQPHKANPIKPTQMGKLFIPDFLAWIPEESDCPLPASKASFALRISSRFQRGTVGEKSHNCVLFYCCQQANLGPVDGEGIAIMACWWISQNNWGSLYAIRSAILGARGSD